MGKAMEVVDSFNTAGGVVATFVAMTQASGDTTGVRSFPQTENAYLADAWGAGATAFIARIRSPRLHDNVNGLLWRPPATARSLVTEFAWQRLFTQDTLVVEATSGAAETDGLSYLVYYPDLPGADARLTTIDAIASRIVNLVNVEVDLGAPGAIGTRAASVALNGTSDLLIGNTDYALLGYEVDVTGLSIGVRGPDTGNLRIGGPMTTEKIETRDYFVRLSKRLGQPCIPIISSANKAGTLIDCVQVAAGGASKVTLELAQLSA